MPAMVRAPKAEATKIYENLKGKKPKKPKKSKREAKLIFDESRRV